MASSVCPEHQVERVRSGKQMRCLVHYRAARSVWDRSEKGRARRSRYRSSDRVRMLRYHQHVRYDIRRRPIQRLEAQERAQADQLVLWGFDRADLTQV